MKIRAILEFDLEDGDGAPIGGIERYRDAAADTEQAIRSRLMGNGFLPDDLLIGCWTLHVDVQDGAIQFQPSPP